jgi:hypothetical protein
MTTLSLARPIENIHTSHEAKVLAIIEHLMPALSGWRLGEGGRDELSALENDIQEKGVALEISKNAMMTARDQHDSAMFNPFNQYNLLTTIGILSVASFIIYFASLGVAWSCLVYLLAIAFIVLVGISNVSKLKKDLSATVYQREVEGAKLSANLADLSEIKARLSTEIASRATRFPEVKVADVRFRLEGARIAGHNVLLDISGAHDAVTLKAIDISGLKSDLTKISERVHSLLLVPPLLTPGERAPEEDPFLALFGEEEQLQDLVNEFTLNLGKVKDAILRLPLVPSQSLLMERLAAGDLEVSENVSAIELSGLIGMQSAIVKFSDQVDLTRESGPQTFVELSEVFESLTEICNLYANARVSSINTIHANVIDVLNRAAWCNRRFYCPRSIQSPKYIEDLLGIEPNLAYLLGFGELMQRLRGDAEIGKRLDAKPEIEVQLHDAYYTIHDFIEGVAFDENGVRKDEGGRPRHMEEQFQEAVKRFANLLQTAMTGAAYPMLNFSSEAQIFYDPEVDEWGSTTLPYVYKTAEAIKYGGLVKAYSDLMVPLWEHLWTEKADFRKSELFRTNDAMIRMSEKESEKLINIADQFRADMRTVRENVHLIESDLKSKYSEITMFRDSMDNLGLLSPRAKEAITDEKLRDILLSDTKLSTTDRYEISLGAIPQSQAQNRGTVYDPIDIVREPNAIVTCRPSTGPRLLSSSEGRAHE